MAKGKKIDELLDKLYKLYSAKAKADAEKKGVSVREGFHSPYTRFKGISYLEAVELLTGLAREQVQTIVSEKFHLFPVKGGMWVVSHEHYTPAKREKQPRDKKAELLGLLNSE